MGSPTVVLVAGGRSSARYWSDDLLNPDAPRSMVLPGVAESTRVCAYDRPGTYAEFDGEIVPSRSDAIAQPRTAPEMAEELHALLQAAEVPGPYVLAGHSFGGFVAFEMARQLRAAGEPVGLVALLDSVGVDWNHAELPFRDDWVAGELARVLFYTVGDRHPGLAWDDLAALPPAERVLRLVGSGEASEVARPLAARLVAVMKANLEAMVRYRPGVVDADLHLFRAREQLDGVLTGQFTVSDAPDLGWGAHSGGAVHVHPVAGNHFSMMGEPHVRALAAAVSSVLDRLLPREARA